MRVFPKSVSVWRSPFDSLRANGYPEPCSLVLNLLEAQANNEASSLAC
jgi:hypothetical protein